MPSNQAVGGLTTLPITSSFTVNDVLTVHETVGITICAGDAEVAHVDVLARLTVPDCWIGPSSHPDAPPS